MDFDRALIIKEHWLNEMFYNGKVWEMRTQKTNIRGKIGLIQSGTGMIIGEANLFNCSKEPIEKIQEYIKYHRIVDLNLLDKWKYAWHLKEIRKFKKPIPYNHPKGAVIWVKID